MTQPLKETPKEKTSTVVSVRLDDDLLARIDQRRTGLPKEMNRNAWMALALDWVLTNLPTGLAHPERDRVATAAPPQVAGDRRVPRGAVRERKPDADGVVADLGPGGF